MRSRACEKGRSFHSGLRFLFRQPVPFEGEQELFARQTAGVTGQLAARTDDPMAGNDDRKKVWQVLTEIPYGQTMTYGEIARRTGNPQASRAVGGANHHNPIPIVIPCHRVIGAGGKLTGYAGGLPRKEFLLALERNRLPK
jgi:methylated-DNA-[protein]-cysteine S-methyltransferase